MVLPLHVSGQPIQLRFSVPGFYGHCPVSKTLTLLFPPVGARSGSSALWGQPVPTSGRLLRGRCTIWGLSLSTRVYGFVGFPLPVVSQRSGSSGFPCSSLAWTSCPPFLRAAGNLRMRKCWGASCVLGCRAPVRAFSHLCLCLCLPLLPGEAHSGTSFFHRLVNLNQK